MAVTGIVAAIYSHGLREVVKYTYRTYFLHHNAQIALLKGRISAQNKGKRVLATKIFQNFPRETVADT